MHAAAERRQDADAPVADLVAEPLDDDGAVRRHRTRRICLVTQKGEQVARGDLLEQELALQALDRGVVRERRQLARGGADLLAELERPADALAFPERHGAGQPRCG